MSGISPLDSTARRATVVRVVAGGLRTTECVPRLVVMVVPLVSPLLSIDGDHVGSGAWRKRCRGHVSSKAFSKEWAWSGETGGAHFAPVFPGLSPIRGGGSMGLSVSTSSLVAHSLTWHGTDIALVEVGVLC